MKGLKSGVAKEFSLLGVLIISTFWCGYLCTSLFKSIFGYLAFLSQLRRYVVSRTVTLPGSVVRFHASR